MSAVMGQPRVVGTRAGSHYWRQAPLPGRTRSYSLLLWTTGLAVFALQFLTQIEGIQRVVTFGSIGVLLASALAKLRARDLRPPAELLFYLGLVLSSLVALPWVVDEPLFLRYWRRIAQLFVLMVLVVRIVRRTGRIEAVMTGFLVASAAGAGYGLLTGELMESLSPGAMTRASGVFDNPNGLAHVCLLGLFATLFLWECWRRAVVHVALTVNAALLVAAIVASGSRGAFVGIVGLMVLWAWFCKLREIRRHPSVLVGLLLVGAFFYQVSTLVLAETFLGQRLRRSESFEELQEKEARVQLFESGWHVFKGSPLIGVGLNQFRAATGRGLIGHADLVELPATTGIVGTALYYAFIFGVGRAAKFSMRHLPCGMAEGDRNRLAFAKVAVWLVVGLGFVTMTFWDIGPMILLSSFLGLAYWHRGTARWRRRSHLAPGGPQWVRTPHLLGPSSSTRVPPGNDEGAS